MKQFKVIGGMLCEREVEGDRWEASTKETEDEMIEVYQNYLASKQVLQHNED